MGQEKGVILLTYSISAATGHLEHLSEEVIQVKDLLRASKIGDVFDIEIEPVDRPEAFTERISKYKGRLVCFSYSGHAGEQEMILAGGAARGESLLGLLKKCPLLKLVLLNGCATKALAKKGKELGIPLLIGTNRSVPDKNAAQFAIRFFGRLSQKDSIIEAIDFANNAAGINASQSPDRGLNVPVDVDNIYWDYFEEENLAQKKFLQLCRMPVPLVFEDDGEGKAKVLFIHDRKGQDRYEKIKDLIAINKDEYALAPAGFEPIFELGNPLELNQDALTAFWEKADAICFLVSDAQFIARFWGKHKDKVIELHRSCCKPLFAVNVGAGKDDFLSFANGFEKCMFFPPRESLEIGVVNIGDYKKSGDTDSGYHKLLKDLLCKHLTDSVDTQHLHAKLQYFNYTTQITNYVDGIDRQAQHQFMVIEGSKSCGHEWLLKRLLSDRNLNISFAANKPIIIDFGGHEINSTEKLWEEIGRNLVNTSQKAEIVVEIEKRLQMSNLIVVLENVYAEGKDAKELKAISALLESFWSEWTGAFARINTSNKAIFAAFNRGYDEALKTGKLDLQPVKNQYGNCFSLEPVRLLTGNYGSTTFEDWHENHNEPVFSKLQYQKLLDKKDHILQYPYIKNVVHEICAVYECEEIADQLFQL